ncbi:MAG: ABC transporter permease [Actinobacteria bacterium]|nr:ABC transporter permease [Actinomycetota bacterium]
MSKRSSEINWGNAAISAAAPIAAVVVAVVIISLLMWASGLNPTDAFTTLGDRLQNKATWMNSIQSAIPLYVSAVAVAIGFKMNLFNIGVEGQYKVAMLATVVVGGAVELPAVLHVLFCLIVAMAAGALWAALPAVLKVYRGVSEVITTIMLNYIAIGVLNFLFSEFWAVKQEGSLNRRSDPLPESAWMPDLIQSNLDRINGFIIVAAVVGVFYYVLVWKSRFGFRLRASGANASAARASGIPPKRMIVQAMLLSGGIAGLVGMTQILGDKHAYTTDLETNLGFNGIAVALLGRNSPIGMAVAAVVFGFLNAASRFLDLNGIPKEIAQIMQGILVLSVVIVYEIARRMKERRTQEIASKALEGTAVAA